MNEKIYFIDENPFSIRLYVIFMRFVYAYASTLGERTKIFFPSSRRTKRAFRLNNSLRTKLKNKFCRKVFKQNKNEWVLAVVVALTK